MAALARMPRSMILRRIGALCIALLVALAAVSSSAPAHAARAPRGRPCTVRTLPNLRRRSIRVAASNAARYAVTARKSWFFHFSRPYQAPSPMRHPAPQGAHSAPFRRRPEKPSAHIRAPRRARRPASPDRDSLPLTIARREAAQERFHVSDRLAARRLRRRPRSFARGSRAPLRNRVCRPSTLAAPSRASSDAAAVARRLRRQRQPPPPHGRKPAAAAGRSPCRQSRSNAANSSAASARSPSSTPIRPRFKPATFTTCATRSRTFPGVYVESRYGQELRLSIRGSNLTRDFHLRGLELLQDGIPMNYADGGGDMYQIDPKYFRAIEVMKGGNALAYGSSTLGGAINFISPTAYTALAPNMASHRGRQLRDGARASADVAHHRQFRFSHQRHVHPCRQLQKTFDDGLHAAQRQSRLSLLQRSRNAVLFRRL